jgi:hypothetical protein
MMNKHVRDLNDQFNNPFKLKFIKNMQSSDNGGSNNNGGGFNVENIFGPCVVMASPGF